MKKLRVAREGIIQTSRNRIQEAVHRFGVLLRSPAQGRDPHFSLWNHQNSDIISVILEKCKLRITNIRNHFPSAWKANPRGRAPKSHHQNDDRLSHLAEIALLQIPGRVADRVDGSTLGCLPALLQILASRQVRKLDYRDGAHPQQVRELRGKKEKPAGSSGRRSLLRQPATPKSTPPE